MEGTPAPAFAADATSTWWSGPPAVLAETLDGGQCFRWHRLANGRWRGVSGACAAELDATSAVPRARLLAGTSADLHHHLASDVDWHALADQLPWRTDAHLARCLTAFPGLRILRQPFGETLLCFLCSATKQVVQIKQMAELLARRCGRPLPVHCHPIVDNAAERRPPPHCQLMDDIVSGPEGEAIHALPTWEELRGVTDADLRACKLGFRARHVQAIAAWLALHPGWLAETAVLPYAEAKARLVALPGVGEKIADCVLLFGAGRLEAFPVDVWVLRAMAQRYGLAGWSPPQVAHFGRVHFGPLAGLAQQYLFAWERRHGRTIRA